MQRLRTDSCQGPPVIVDQRRHVGVVLRLLLRTPCLLRLPRTLPIRGLVILNLPILRLSLPLRFLRFLRFNEPRRAACCCGRCCRLCRRCRRWRGSSAAARLPGGHGAPAGGARHGRGGRTAAGRLLLLLRCRRCCCCCLCVLHYREGAHAALRHAAPARGVQPAGQRRGAASEQVWHMGRAAPIATGHPWAAAATMQQ